MTRKVIYLLCAFCLWYWLMGGDRDALTAHSPAVEYYQLKIPDSLPPPVYNFKNNPLKKKGSP